MTFNEYFKIAENARQEKKLQIERDIADALLEFYSEGKIDKETYDTLYDTSMYALNKIYKIGEKNGRT